MVLGLSQSQSLTILAIGVSLIVLYILYLVLRVNCKLDSSLKTAKSTVKCPIAELKVDFKDYADELTTKLMNSVDKVTKDSGKDDKYKHQLLREIYGKFRKLNEDVLPSGESNANRKFLDNIKEQIDEYEKRTGDRSQCGGGKKDKMALNDILEANAALIYKLFPVLKN
jgi:hypothetical protein